MNPHDPLQLETALASREENNLGNREEDKLEEDEEEVDGNWIWGRRQRFLVWSVKAPLQDGRV